MIQTDRKMFYRNVYLDETVLLTIMLIMVTITMRIHCEIITVMV